MYLVQQDISLTNQSNAASGNSFSSGDSLNFTGSGELDNGLTVTSNAEVDGGNSMTEVLLSQCQTWEL